MHMAQQVKEISEVHSVAVVKFLYVQIQLKEQVKDGLISLLWQKKSANEPIIHSELQTLSSSELTRMIEMKGSNTQIEPNQGGSLQQAPYCDESEPHRPLSTFRKQTHT